MKHSSDRELRYYKRKFKNEFNNNLLKNKIIKKNENFLKIFKNNILKLKKHNNNLTILNNNLNFYKYDLLVSCGSDLNWTMEYFISLNDILWFRNEGKIEFLKYKNENIKELNSIIDYNCAISIHNKLCMLFELQIGEEYELNECI